MPMFDQLRHRLAQRIVDALSNLTALERVN
jgi:hypothetical protein